MKSKNGGKGMTDEQVKTYAPLLSVHLDGAYLDSFRFIDRYIPGYVFFSEGVRSGYTKLDPQGLKTENRVLPPWLGHSLAITIDEHRNVVDTEKF